MNGGNVIFKFTGDDGGLKSSINGVKSSFGNMTKSILAATGITKAFSSAMNMVTGSTDQAITRLDALNQFPKVMSNLGISADESQKSIEKMSEKLKGLPTTLDQGAMAVQRFTSKNGDVGKSTDMFLALNNAILAGGANSQIQSNAIEQLSQAYAKGKMDMMEWRSIQTAMPAQLKQVASAMGMDTEEMGIFLREGDNTAEFMEQFMQTIQDLNVEGIEGFQNFEQQARNSTGGIKTAITVMKTRVAQGMAELIKTIDEGLANYGGLSGVLTTIGDTIKKAMQDLAPILKDALGWLIKNLPTIINFLKFIAPIVLTIVSAFKAYSTTVKIISTVTKTWAIVQALLNGTLMLNPIGLIVAGIVALITVIVLLYTKCEWFRNLVKAVFDFFKTAFNLVVEYFKMRIKAMIEAVKLIIEVGKSVLKWFKELPGKVVEIGLNIVKGIGKGITNGITWLKNKIKEFVGNVTSFIKKIFKIGSPSKLMADQVGKFIPQGIAIGIDANTNSVYDAMKDMQKDISSQFGLSPQLLGSSSLHHSSNVIVNNELNVHTDPLGQTVGQIKTFANGSKNDYNYGMGV